MEKIESKAWDKYASVYHQYIISPFQKGVQNPLLDYLRKIPQTKSLVVADLGCGPGEFLPILSKKFGKVYALDFSKEMIKISKERNSDKENIHFKVADLRELSKHNLNLDIAIAVNSVLDPSIRKINKIMKEIYNSINEKGVFLGIFPSMEAIIHYSMLIYENELEKNDDEKIAIRKARRKAERSKYCFIRGIYKDDPDRQKFFYKFELKRRLEDAGFNKVSFKKVYYPWNKNGDFKGIKNKPMMWDWFVSAKK